MKNIDWTKWSSIAEIVSSIAILITLVYLAVQTQQTSDAIISQSRQSMFESAQFEQSMWLQHPELTVLIVDNSLEMTLSQKAQLDSLLIMTFSRRDFAYRQYRAGALDESSWAAEVEIISLLLGTERTRGWWSTVGTYAFDQDFVDLAQSIIRDQPLHPYWIDLAEW